MVDSTRRMFSPDWIPILLSQAVALACGIVGVRLYSAWVTPETYGAYGLFLTLTPLGGQLTHAGLVKHAGRYWPEVSDQRGYFRWWIKASRTPAIQLAGLVLLLVVFSRLAAPQWVLPLAFAFPAALAGVYAQASQSCLQSVRRHWLDFGITSLVAGTRTFLPLVSVGLFGATVATMAAGFIGHSVVVTVVAGAVLFRTTQRGTGRTETFADLGAFLRSFAWNGALTIVNAGMVRWISGWFHGPEILGFVTLAGNLGLVLPNVISAACSQYFYPRLMERQRVADRNGLRLTANQGLAFYSTLTALAGGALWFILPWLPGRLIAPGYAASIPFVLPMFAFGASLGLVTLLQNELLVALHPTGTLRVAGWATAILALGTGSTAAHSLEAMRIFLLLSPVLILPLTFVTGREAWRADEGRSAR